MAGVFQNIDLPRPLTPRLWWWGRTHSLGGEGGGRVNILEDARHSSVLYVCKYFVLLIIPNRRDLFAMGQRHRVLPPSPSFKRCEGGSRLWIFSTAERGKVKRVSLPSFIHI
jgi:hypothetical protein